MSLKKKTTHSCPAFVSGEGRYLVLGDLGKYFHHRFQAGVDESLLQLLVLGSSVVHFVVLPLLKPLVVGEGNQAQCGLAWSRERKHLSDKTVLSSRLSLLSFTSRLRTG